MSVNIDSMIDWVAFYTERLPSKPMPAGDRKYNACCPFHQEKNPSFWFNTENGMWKCETGCGSGNATTFLARYKNIDNAEAWAELRSIAGIENKPRTVLPHTLEEYASAKRLPIDFLQTLGLHSAPGNNYVAPYVAIPYYDADGASCAIKRRFNPQNKQRFGWDKGGAVSLYGLWLDLNKVARALVLVEGESDAQSLWFHGVPALGVPGASNYQSAWTQSFIGERSVYVHIEPDKGGATFREKTLQALWDSGYKGKAFTFSCHESDPDCKDPSDMHIKYGDAFRVKFDALIRNAKPVDLGAECMKVVPAKETKPAGKTVAKLQTYKAADLYGKYIEKPPVIIRGLIPIGLTILAAAPKRGKSWLSLLMAICVAGGRPFLGMETTQGDVLYLDLESRQYRIQDRLSKLLVGQAPESLQICHDSGRLDGSLLEQLASWCDDVSNPRLIIIDTLGRVKGGSRRGENAYEGDTRILGEVQKFALERKIAVVCVHHLRKAVSEEDYFERISGSMGISGACDSVMVIQGKRGEPESILRVDSRDFEAIDLVLSFDGGLWSLRSTDSEAYRKEQEYNGSSTVRGVVKLANVRQYWQGTPKELMDELLNLGTLDVITTPAEMSKALQPFQQMLHERDSVLVNWAKTGGVRRITIKKVDAAAF